MHVNVTVDYIIYRLYPYITPTEAKTRLNKISNLKRKN